MTTSLFDISKNARTDALNLNIATTNIILAIEKIISARVVAFSLYFHIYTVTLNLVYTGNYSVAWAD